ncbi:MAG: 50S ribosomal protein L32 [Thermaerobacter sp.]|nr:50S ribosomal protein L32 [Thermaerobacter sp.]
MAVPKRKHSKARRDSRRANWKLPPLTLTPCPQCKKLRVPHHACQNCGYYDGREAIHVD